MRADLTFQGKTPSLNDYVDACRSHAQVGARMKREHQERLAWQAKAWLTTWKHPAFSRPVTIECYWHEPTQRRDLDNVAAFGRKVLLDALVAVGILATDSPKVVRRICDHHVHDRAWTGVKVHIEELPGASAPVAGRGRGAGRAPAHERSAS